MAHESIGRPIAQLLQKLQIINVVAGYGNDACGIADQSTGGVRVRTLHLLIEYSVHNVIIEVSDQNYNNIMYRRKYFLLKKGFGEIPDLYYSKSLLKGVLVCKSYFIYSKL